MLNNIDLSDITIDNIGSWPMIIKITVCIFVLSTVVFLGYWFHIRGQNLQVHVLQKREIVLRNEFEKKQHISASLEVYKQQLGEIRRSFGMLLRQLPSKTEVPGLLEDISKNGIASGLEFKLFDPGDEVRHDFYAELPIQIIVLGDYHQFGQFVSRVAALGRIVTVHNLKILPNQNKNLNAGQKQQHKQPNQINLNAVSTQHHYPLTMQLTAKTYRYIDEEEQEKLHAKK